MHLETARHAAIDYAKSFRGSGIIGLCPMVVNEKLSDTKGSPLDDDILITEHNISEQTVEGQKKLSRGDRGHTYAEYPGI